MIIRWGVFRVYIMGFLDFERQQWFLNSFLIDIIILLGIMARRLENNFVKAGLPCLDPQLSHSPAGGIDQTQRLW